jgi:hypothetical protein
VNMNLPVEHDGDRNSVNQSAIARAAADGVG